jgi:hypothetical protein
MAARPDDGDHMPDDDENTPPAEEKEPPPNNDWAKDETIRKEGKPESYETK